MDFTIRIKITKIQINFSIYLFLLYNTAVGISSFLYWLAAISPVLIVLLLMTFFNWGGSKAGVLTWLATQCIALVFFGAGIEILLTSYIKSFFLAIDVLLIIWGAMFLYQITKNAGTIQRLGSFLADLTNNKTILAIFLGWLFPSFLQGMGGFGVPVAVSAPLLVSAGFSPTMAVIITSIGHGWGVSFGSMGSSIRTMQAVTGLPETFFGPTSAFLLGIIVLFSGLLVTYLSSEKGNIREALPLTLISAAILAAGQYLISRTDLWIVAVTIPALISLLTAFSYMIFTSKGSKSFFMNMGKDKRKEILHSVSPYVILIILILTINFSQPLRKIFLPAGFSISFPELITSRGFVTPAQESKAINLFLHPGTILIISSLISFVFLKNKGYLRERNIRQIGQETFQRSLNSTIAIFSLVGTASLMNHAGMTHILAEGISTIFPQPVYPFMSPFIGALGAFITGSNNNSNILFGAMQMQSANLMNLSISLILAAQTAGGAIGSIMAPAKVILGCSTVGLSGQEGKVIKILVLYCGALILILGISTLALSAFIS